MLIKIDFRETELYAALNQLLAIPENVKYTTTVKLQNCSIPLGDIILSQEEEDSNTSTTNDKIIIERKTLYDLAASIRDGRYAEQSFRLNECNVPNHNIFYAIEGDLRSYKSSHFSKNKIDKKALLSSMTSIHYYKGFSVMRTINVMETAEWIIQMADKIHREQIKKEVVPFYAVSQMGALSQMGAAPAPGESETIGADVNTAYTDVIPYTTVVANKRIKKENITIENIGEIMLTQIPGISANVAIAVMKKYGTIKNLIETLRETAIETSPLKEIVIGDSARKLNKTNIANIYIFLMQ